MANERKTENLARDQLRQLGYYDEERSTRVEEQKSEIEQVKRLLKSASKTGKGGKGAPEFIVSDSSTPDFLIVIECKAHVNQHESANRDDPVGFAIDGALHYARYLSKEFNVISKEFNVIAVAVCGQTKAQLIVSTFLQPKGAERAKELQTKFGIAINTIIPWADYIEQCNIRPCRAVVAP